MSLASSDPSWQPSTVAVHAGRPARTLHAPVNEPISMTTTFFADSTDARYVRDGTPTLEAFEAALGGLEGGVSVAFASGMAASTAVFELLPLGAVVVATRSLYSGNALLFDRWSESGRLSVVAVDGPDALADAVTAVRPALVWAEAVSNPMIETLDIPAVAAACRSVEALLAVDATFVSPAGVQPLALGADFAMHSVTKVIAGHSDALMGAVSAAPELAARLADQRHLVGSQPGTLEAFLALRGLRTLPLRLDRMRESTATLAARLAEHPAVSRVRFAPASYVLSFEVVGGGDAAQAVCDAVRLCLPATSLGGVETLIERRGRYAIDAGRGTPDSLLRLSVGIEDVEDIWSDLTQALDAKPST
ncbi:trans-sulfuration enzyme family protein [Jatrophihabitans sp. YIM 134969]